MSEPSRQSQIEAAQAYDSLFVPALFEQWVEWVANAVALQTGEKVLDIACGTGVLARAAAARIGQSGYVAAIDPAPGMLSVAEEKAPTVDWRQGVAENLPFPDQSFDAVLSQFGIMFFQDPDKSVREMLRVLRPSGRLAVAAWDVIEESPGYAAELALVQRLAGEAAAEAVRAPFTLGDRQALRALFQDAGATSIEMTTRTGIARFPGIRTMVEAELRGWLPIMGVHLAEALIEEILVEAESALEPYVMADGTIAFALSAHLVTAKKS